MEFNRAGLDYFGSTSERAAGLRSFNSDDAPRVLSDEGLSGYLEESSICSCKKKLLGVLIVLENNRGGEGVGGGGRRY